MKCAMCDTPLDNPKQKFCSKPCANAAIGMIKRGVAAYCKECGRVYEFANKRGKKSEFCSPRCQRRYAARAKRKADKADKPSDPNIKPWMLTRGDTMMRSGSVIEAGWLG